MKRSDDQRKARITWIILVGIEVICAIITLCAFADVLFGLGWGYSWKAVLMGIGTMLWGVVVWFVCRTIFRIFGVSEPGS